MAVETWPTPTDTEQLNVNLHAFPNPVRDLLKVDFQTLKESTEEVRVIVLDPLGRMIIEKQEAVKGGNNTIQVNTSDLNGGIYTLHVIENQMIKTQKFMKIE